MKTVRKSCILFSTLTLFILILAVYSVSFNKTPVKLQYENDLTLTARFERPDRTALSGMNVAVRFAQEEHTARLSEDGEATFFNIPKEGELALSLSDCDHREVNRITLQITLAAVTDASTDANGIGHVSVKRDAKQMTLLFVLNEENHLQCSLYLDQETHNGSREEQS